MPRDPLCVHPPAAPATPMLSPPAQPASRRRATTGAPTRTAHGPHDGRGGAAAQAGPARRACGVGTRGPLGYPELARRGRARPPDKGDDARHRLERQATLTPACQPTCWRARRLNWSRNHGDCNARQPDCESGYR
jgi:hypothetical protein